MAEIHVGDLVRFVEQHDFDPAYHPRYGAIGKVEDVIEGGAGIHVIWDQQDLPEQCLLEHSHSIENGHGLYCSSFRVGSCARERRQRNGRNQGWRLGTTYEQ